MDRAATQSEGMHPAEGIALMRDVLRQFPINPTSVHFEVVPHAQGFSGAMIVRVTAHDRAAAPVLADRHLATLCLRGWPRSSLPHQRLRELHRFLRFLRDQGVQVVPVPIPDLRGETLVSRDGQFWQLEPWMPGLADFHRSPTDARLQSAMRTLARVHVAAARFAPTAAGREWFAGPLLAPSPAVRERLTLIEVWTDQRLSHADQAVTRAAESGFAPIVGEIVQRFRLLREPVHADLQAALRIAVPLQVCFRDVWHDHLLFTGDELTGLVDPSAARTESVAADLSRLLGSLLGKWSERWDAALEMYRQVRPLAEQEYRLVRILHRSGALLSGMTWIDRHRNGEIPREMLPTVVNRLEGIRDQLEE